MERRTGYERRRMQVENWRPLPFSSTVAIDEQVRPAAADRRSGMDRRHTAPAGSSATPRSDKNG
ncbi:hypothetical protein [Noviherbaspirillum aridicola]|uniref:hypothetical protein n=1 Tax=Noviherbaspirillum aridicola TaxID=2849687 RepID=UPI001C809047|nr:hypothetical protein [Noviherbaspirillum aridicola]